MTEKEAIKILKRDLNLKKENKYLPDNIEAMKMAVKALKNKVANEELVQQIQWERDFAIEQLAEIDKGLGESMNDVRDAVARHTARKPNFAGNKCNDGNDLDYDTWICPCCEKRYKIDYEKYDYCPSCGQAICWEDEDDCNFGYDDYCYECQGYGDDYSTTDEGELECNCLDCPFNSTNSDDD